MFWFSKNYYAFDLRYVCKCFYVFTLNIKEVKFLFDVPVILKYLNVYGVHGVYGVLYSPRIVMVDEA